jgi:hypothetical protein
MVFELMSLDRLVAIAAIPTSVIAFILIPPFLDTKTAVAQRWTHRQRLRQVDLLGGSFRPDVPKATTNAEVEQALSWSPSS